MDLRGKTFLVIGGAGFIGSHLVDALLHEDVARVIVFDNFSRGTRENLENALGDNRVEVFPLGGDLLHQDILKRAFEQVDGVFHLAALWLLHCHEFEPSAFKVNIEGTFNVLQALIQSNAKKLVYSSSASVYGDAVTEPMKEDHPFNNTNFYGATKVAGEQFCRSLFHRHKESDAAFDYVGLRYMNVYGPRQDYRGAYIAVIMKILDRLDQGKPPVVYGDGSQSYDFVSVKDCARANICAMKSEATDEFYNVGTGVKTSIRELTEMILRISGSPLEIQYEPSGPTFVKNRVGCPQKAEREIDFRSTVSLEQGLSDLIEWRRTHIDEVEERRRYASMGS
ncbi:MAG: SDR family NAD(P)-dependent oxidoreductase [Bdellovibrionales bacterium]|nr:SDR family NAD(P)-dependent oxidoreductase [Bdellovibrionales bacterium]